MDAGHGIHSMPARTWGAGPSRRSGAVAVAAAARPAPLRIGAGIGTHRGTGGASGDAGPVDAARLDPEPGARWGSPSGASGRYLLGAVPDVRPDPRFLSVPPTFSPFSQITSRRVIHTYVWMGMHLG